MAKHPTDDRRKALCAWLSANGVNPNAVPVDADMTIEKGTDGRFLRCEIFDLDQDGRKQLDERQEIACITVSVPLAVEPPEWWQPYQKPTRDQLLSVLKSIQDLANEQGELNTYIERARLRAVLSLACEREGMTAL